VDEDYPPRRQAWTEGPDPAVSPVGHDWLSLSDDDLLFRIHSLPADHGADEALVGVISSNRHFFVRQEAAKRVRNPEKLRELWDDRHVGQILVRGLTRREDVEYLKKLLAQSRHLDVRNAAQAQLNLIARKNGGNNPNQT